MASEVPLPGVPVDGDVVSVTGVPVDGDVVSVTGVPVDGDVVPAIANSKHSESCC
jgi:hypothetical protein